MVKFVLVTGATSGIGKATATIFAKNGYNLIITGRREARLEELKYKLKKKYAVKIKTLVFDIQKLSAVKKAVKSLEGDWANVDILVNNAGLALGLDPIHSGNVAHWDTMIDTNVKGLLYITRLISPQMIERKDGHIINICSTAAKDIYPNGAVYCASKSAVDMLTKGMRLDFYKYGIKVSQIAPGMVEETEFAITRFEGDEKKANIYSDFQPLTSKDVAETIFYVATRPKHVNIQDVLMMSVQQAGSNFVDRSGKK
jgi:NADP-dependent 3-hydroxy acid dehydrogenase YdfG